MSEPRLAFTYIGQGKFSHAVPARDLTVDEFERMDGRQQRIVNQSGWYKPVATKPSASKDDAGKSDKGAKE